MTTTKTKIYRINLLLNDTIDKYEDEDESICVFATDDKEKAEEIYEKLSENKNLKYVLS